MVLYLHEGWSNACESLFLPLRASSSDCSPLKKLEKEVQQVAFSAALTNSDETLGPSERDVTLIFKHVVTNIGNAYNPHTGFFTAPVRGAYHFEWHIGDIGGRSPATAAALVKNSERVFSAYANLTPSHFETSSESATLQLEAGDVVSVNKWATSGIYDNVNHHVTFSGHLLFTM
uniref:complement C1q-like protein 2 n=1 Tax=Monopterus albus TaxID=43700 RepID=UPI0009B34D8E|nr:complement C1q-like protein 2 [Monopterus albus]